MKVRILLVLLIYVIPILGVQAQADTADFSGLLSKGQLPSDFLDSWAKKYEQRLEEKISSAASSEYSLLSEFWQQQYRYIDAMIQNGRFSFGDDISIYLNEIKDRVLENDPELKKVIRVYLFKSPSVNAFSIADGIIVINTGLVAHVRSEAELAFVIAHEIAHYQKEHVFESFKTAKAENYSNWFSPSVNPIKRFDELMARSRLDELEADALGLEIFMKTNYSLLAVDSAFTTLHESYVSYGRKQVTEDFLSTPRFSIPPSFYRDEVDPIEKEEDYFDQTHRHPNIASRRRILDSIMGDAGREQGVFYQLGEDRFRHLQQQARLELVREKVLYGEYADALYDIYVLRDEFPQSKYLDLEEVRALYGLAEFKSVDLISDVTESGFRVDGPVQQVYHVMRQFNCEQLNALALHYTYRAQKKYPEEDFLNKYVFNLTRNLLVNCQVEPDLFRIEGSHIPEFTAIESDFESSRQFIRAKQAHYADFYKYLLAEEYRSGVLVNDMEQHIAFRDSMLNERYITNKDQKDRQKEAIEAAEENGPGFNVEKLILLDPTILVINYSDDRYKQLEALKRELNYKTMLPTWAGEAGIETRLLYVEEMKSNDIDMYNQFSMLEEWVTEAAAYGRRDIIPTNLDIQSKVGTDKRYLCRIIGVVAEGETDFYFFGLFDLSKGELVYSRYVKLGRNLTDKELERETRRDFEWISR